MERKVDMIENEIGEVRDELYDDLLYLNPENPEYDICMAKLNLCDRFLEYISILGKRSR